MSAINEDTVAAWRAIAADVSADRPIPGRRVTIMLGRKHKGRAGVVVRHEPSRYENAFRYGGDAMQHMTEMRGRYGFRVQVRTDDGEVFWTEADYCLVDGRQPVGGVFTRSCHFEPASLSGERQGVSR